MKKLTLGKILLAYVILMSLIVFPFLYFKISDIFNSSFEKHVSENAKSIAVQTFNSMFQVMKRGWSRQDLVAFLESVKKSQKDYEVEIYRTKIVENLFGKINQPKFDEKLENALKIRRDIIENQDGIFRYIMPVKAEKICLKCHTNAKEGDVLGIIEVKYHLKKYSQMAEKEFSKALLLILPLPFLVVIFLGYLITDKIKSNLNKLNEVIDNASQMKDLEKITTKNIDFFIYEFNELFLDIKKIMSKLSNIAVDKEVLEFEIKLLEKFILTSDVIKDWKEYVMMLLIEINKIIPTYSIFSIFREDDRYEVEVFWLGTPSKVLKIKVEEILKEKIRENFRLKQDDIIEINHNVSEKDKCVLDNIYNEIEYETKTLFLEKPRIGGIVGIGVQPDVKKDKTKLIVIESVLSTLLNVIGSVKAIHKYTKDLEYYATRDPLTNLYNQRVFWELANYEIERAKRRNYNLSILFIDLDNFKSVNDVYGHDFGDNFLIKVANFFEKNLRPGDIIARYGGDEFVIILPETDLEGAYTVAERILKNAESFLITTPDGKTINPMFSIGVATYPDHADNIKELFAIADTMMYKAKLCGKNQIKVPSEDDITEFFEKENEMSVILLESIRKEKIIPYFQPIVNSKNNKVEAYEVLSRIEVNNELIPASKFIEIAEKTGLIFKMDILIIKKAFEKLKNRDERIFINLTPKVLIASEYLTKVKKLVNEYHISPERIVFEITERDTVRNFSLLEKFVLNLKEAGFKFAIDDFGSGFSSFYYVKQLPIDFVKIEGDFIKNIIRDEKDKAFVESIVSLCKKLDIKTIAEFVESEEILEIVKEIGIDYAQGFYVGKPSPDIENLEVNND